MAQIEHIVGADIFIEISDGADPEVWEHPIAINTTRSFAGSASTVDSNIADPDNWKNPSFTYRDKDGISWQISGEGTFDTASMEKLVGYLHGAPSLRMRVRAQSLNGHMLVGNFHLTSLEVSGERLGKSTGSMTFMSDGPIIPTALS